MTDQLAIHELLTNEEILHLVKNNCNLFLQINYYNCSQSTFAQLAAKLLKTNTDYLSQMELANISRSVFSKRLGNF